MIELIDILAFAGILAFCYQFWQLRLQSEQAVNCAQSYCEKNNLQYISCARIKTRLVFFRKEMLSWRSQYQFEFSGNGEDKSNGYLVLENRQLIDIQADVYKL